MIVWRGMNEDYIQLQQIRRNEKKRQLEHSCAEGQMLIGEGELT